MRVKENTILGMDLFNNALLDSLIFHVPHSKTDIPDEFKSDFISDEITNKEIVLLTDFSTDEIFYVENSSRIVFPYSRVFCDVERLPDEQEFMFEVGRGFFYTSTDCGQTLRVDNTKNKNRIYKDYYTKHHNDLSNLVDNKIRDNHFAIIIDCHSYSDVPLKTDLHQNAIRTDFCLGTDSFHTPKWLIDMVYNHLNNLDYSVEINSPYEGTIVPSKHYKKDQNVLSIMIEVNRRLYMDGSNVDNEQVAKLNKVIRDLFKTT